MVYFLKIDGHDFIKIGYTARNNDRRIKELSIGSPFNHILLLLIDGDMNYERELHYKFHNSHHRSEWFLYSEEIQQFIEENKEKNIHIEKIPNKTRKGKWIKVRLDIKQDYESGMPIEEMSKKYNKKISTLRSYVCDHALYRPGQKEIRENLCEHPPGYWKGHTERSKALLRYKEGRITLNELKDIYKKYPPKKQSTLDRILALT